MYLGSRKMSILIVRTYKISIICIALLYTSKKIIKERENLRRVFATKINERNALQSYHSKYVYRSLYFRDIQLVSPFPAQRRKISFAACNIT